MRDYKIIRYSKEYFQIWNEFISKSKNGTFLFHRNFIEYHKDRFEDFSLLVFRKNKLVTVLPANKVDNTLHSHQGLSYGGVIVKPELKFNILIELFREILSFLNGLNIIYFEIKMLPSIYSQFPNDELLYMMFLLDAELIKRESLSVINNEAVIKISRNRMEGVKRGEKHNLRIIEENSFDAFWNEILIPNLNLKHKVSPVHSLEEILLLKEYFPNNIRQFNTYYENTLVAGATIFETKNVAHCQYISGNIEKNILGSLDLLHYHLISNVFSDKKYFDFGSSNENDGKQVNRGLQYWKEGFGARIITQDFYRIKTENYKLLNGVFI
ncbi:GNAT family N-acetyltransferase [Seonamhaeicola aphaedonensis]|uniref:Acetyltransferase (GNAT) family protein n=1 Tax=Seonamhaeicola aphaedonensis TaxID=1461338 RepID=A0A3D9HG52_9FLAO|nr:GNAT family N-acetyltransferase [Seonamhaeicola aphaedonensis]RED48458.1 hypothetical protein DFQ02_104304 [Seonamhaeicola aphaedonensis]